MGNGNRDPGRRLMVVRPAEYGLPAEPITDASQLGDVLGIAADQGCHVLAPLTTLDRVPPGYGLAVRAYQMGPSDVYQVDGGGVALSGVALALLAEAASLDWAASYRLDDGRQQYLWVHQVELRRQSFDGVWRRIRGTKELDLRDGSPAAEKAMGAPKDRDGKPIPDWKRRQKLAQARLYGGPLAESFAFNRAVRKALGIRTYTSAELRHPFVVPVLVPMLDLSDPEIRRMVAATQLGIAAQVYGSAAPTGPGLGERLPLAEGFLAERGQVLDTDPDTDPDTDERRPPALPPPQDEAPPERPRERERVRAVPQDDDMAELGRWAEDPGPPPTWMGGGHDRQPDEAPPPPPRTSARPPAGEPVCATCGAKVPPNVADYSRRAYGQVLCRDDQRGRRT